MIDSTVNQSLRLDLLPYRAILKKLETKDGYLVKGIIVENAIEIPLIIKTFKSRGDYEPRKASRL